MVQRRPATEKERWVAAALREPSPRASGAWLSVGTWAAAAGCRRLPSLAVLQKRGGMSAHSQQHPGHICCCSSSSAKRVWPPAAIDGSSRMSDSDGASEPTTATTSNAIVPDFTILNHKVGSSSVDAQDGRGAIFSFQNANSRLMRGRYWVVSCLQLIPKGAES